MDRRRRPGIWRPLRRISGWSAALIATTVAGAGQLHAAEEGFRGQVTPLVKEFCLDCHAGKDSDANLDLERMLAGENLEASFKNWQKVVAMLERGKMPPEDASQPSESQRRELIRLVAGELKQAIASRAGDPGEVVLRRLTSAEYAYTIADLTGLALNLEKDFVNDGVGGEGFTNVGNAQFIEDATLERYLQAAKQIASHAVIGAGPLTFFRDGGKSGLELSAMHRIQEIYWKYGFRTAAGEGGVPYGLDRYPKALFAAWRYRHREALGVPSATFASLAAKEGLAPQFVEHVWSLVTASSPTYPSSEIAQGWQALPVPTSGAAELQQQVRTKCDELYQTLLEMQKRLAAAVGDEEEAAVLSEKSLIVAKTQKFTARLLWPPDTKIARIQLSVLAADPGRQTTPVVIWHNPRFRWRRFFRQREEPKPLASVVPAKSAAAFAFGQHPAGGAVEPQDFVTRGAASRSFDIEIPEGSRGAELTVEAELDLVHGDDGVIRCEIASAGQDAPLRAFSASLLADPQGAAFATWREGVLEFARLWPQVSHREPAPSDRDPIPEPFNNTYNMPERNFFHIKVKYHRDDQFLIEKMLDDEERQRLDEAWSDLLGSFEYHDIWLRFVADKFQLNLGDRKIGDLDERWIEGLPEPARGHVKTLHDNFVSIQRRWRNAEAGHVEDLLRLAERAWRRPLTSDETQRLRTFYRSLRDDSQLDHEQTLRAVLARVLVAPSFLYRAELPQQQAGRFPLTDWEVASRLSYFLWSSLPDEELARAAAAGELREVDQVARQARRMLADPKARRLASEFFGQWLGFYQFDRWRGVDAQRFPEFSDALKTSLHDEAVSFFEHIVRQDRPVNEMLFADYTFLNDDLAKHYGAPATVAARNLTRVENAGAFHRGGLLGLGAVLTATSAPLRTSPVKRGDWVLRRLLGTPVPPPPADAGSIAADDVLPDGPRTIRARLDAHRRNPACTNCHSRIDPLGFGLENFDALGRWRDEYRDGTPIEPTGVLSDGTEIKGVDGLKSYLHSQHDAFERTLCTKLLAYALGRAESLADQQTIEDLLGAIRTGEGRFSDLVVRVVASPQFRYHRGQTTSQATERAAVGKGE